MAYGYNPQQQNNNIPQFQNNQQMMNQQVVQPLFPQPQGNVYNINSTLEVANVPVGAGVSVALCLPESVMYIKTMQNGNPLFYPYKIIPFSNERQEEKQIPNTQSTEQTQIPIDEIMDKIKKCCEKIDALEEKFTKAKKGADWNI